MAVLNQASPMAATHSPMYSGVVAQRVGVICKGCAEGIEIDDEYIPGIQGAEVAARLYSPFALKFFMRSGPTLIDRNTAWEKKLTCGNPDCGETHGYRSDDLRLYDD
jgi:hypothetical protein